MAEMSPQWAEKKGVWPIIDLVSVAAPTPKPALGVGQLHTTCTNVSDTCFSRTQIAFHENQIYESRKKRIHTIAFSRGTDYSAQITVNNVLPHH